MYKNRTNLFTYKRNRRPSISSKYQQDKVKTLKNNNHKRTLKSDSSVYGAVMREIIHTHTQQSDRVYGVHVSS